MGAFAKNIYLKLAPNVTSIAAVAELELQNFKYRTNDDSRTNFD